MTTPRNIVARALAVLFGLGALLSHPAHAGRPMVTEDAGVLDSGDCELESFKAWARARQSASEQLLSAQIGCGIGWNSQLALAASRWQSGSARTPGLTLSGKTALNQATEGGAAWALAWAVAAEDDGSWSHTGHALNGVVSVPLNDTLNLHANLGWSHARREHQQTTHWAIGLEQSLNDRWDLTGESFGDDRDHDPWFQIGLRWAALPERLSLDTSLGRQSGSQQATVFSLGLKLAF